MRAQFNRTILLAGATVTPVVALVEYVVSTLDRSTQTQFNFIPYVIVTLVSTWQLRSDDPNADWLTHPVAYGLIALNVFERVGETDIGGVSNGITIAVVIVLGIIGAVTAKKMWLGQAATMAITLAVWGVWVGLEMEMSTSDSLLHGVVPGMALIMGATLLRRLTQRLQSHVSETGRLARFHEAISECAEFLSQGSTDEPGDALRALLTATEASSVFVTRNVDDPVRGLCLSMVAEVVDAGVPEDPPGMWDLVPWTAVPYAFDSLSKGRPVYYRIEDTSPGEQALYRALGVHAECNIPIMIDGEWHGVLGFSYVGESRFQESDFALLTTAARIFGAQWKAQEQRDELEHLLRSKDELIAAVSHELRTPLTGILGFAEALLETTQPSNQEYVSLIADQSRDMADIIEDLLVSARVEVGTLAVARMQVDIAEVTESVVASSAIQAAAQGRSLTVDLDRCRAIGDPTRIRQIMRNLITNAINHGGQAIAIRMTEEAGQSHVCVWDNGTTLTEESAERLFDRFYTGQRPRTQPGSVGLGLFLSRHLAQLMGGDLTVDIEEGTEFRLTLPNLIREPVDSAAG